MRDPLLYQHLDADLSELEGDRQMAWVWLGVGIVGGVATFAYPILTESGCKGSVPLEDVPDCENQRISLFAVPASLFAAAGVLMFSITRPSSEEVAEVVRKHGLKARAGLALSLDPKGAYPRGQLQLIF
jgi:hypothetical protein